MLKHVCILLPGLVSLFWTALFAANWRKNSRSQHIWTIVMAFITLSMGIMAFFWYSEGNYSLYYKMDILDYVATLSFIPFIFLYFREVTGDTGRWAKGKAGLLFLPPVVLGCVTATVYFLLGDEQAAAFSRATVEDPESLRQTSFLPYKILYFAGEYLYSISIAIQAIVVFVYAFRRLYRYRSHLEDFFSDTEDKDLKYHWAALRGLFVLLLLTLAVAASGYLQYIPYDIWVSIIPAVIGICLFIICYHVSLSHYTAASFARELLLSDEKAIIEESENTDDAQNTYLKFLPRFNELMDQEQIFRQKKLHLDDVATLVGTNRAYLSYLLRDEYHTGFGEFINRKRIAYAKEQARLNPELTVDELAECSGFSHGSTFCRTFRQYEGVTFRTWQKSA
ncbi:helix-turn-helix transcriptional regulator [Parabacteroides sp. PF5-6]|uniref:helix-turn-helix transcriptional regulator n=1 Tax=Parabacteroides sp. PF5-6 TaxID=1742403 RepID=UPI002405C2EE|nr:helix-turn-helix transcriptional regulator [Parabacteroides sp. PF5-6]MDF9830402.1 AraC-like DNA-binding protein [Parabacteroides sp. PF5-6]